MMPKFICLLFLLFTISLPLSAQSQDAENCKDHPAFSRMPGFYIYGCAENYAELELKVGADGKSQKEEGNLTHIVYEFDQETGKKQPSWLQITRNYENAILKLGGKKIFRDDDVACFQFSLEGKTVWLQLTLTGGNTMETSEFQFDLLEKEAMKQEITANQILEALNQAGAIALYINFETGKSDIKSESQPIIDQIAEMLLSNPGMKISIQGHTDNVGVAASNQTLSENRARSVLNAVSAKGIDKSRLNSKGFGATKPIADNSTEEGRAKNRRVEIVKI